MKLLIAMQRTPGDALVNLPDGRGGTAYGMSPPNAPGIQVFVIEVLAAFEIMEVKP